VELYLHSPSTSPWRGALLSTRKTFYRDVTLQIMLDIVLVNVKAKSLCLTDHHAIKTYWDGGIAPRILDVRTTWR
jgi:hypothetical protein